MSDGKIKYVTKPLLEEISTVKRLKGIEGRHSDSKAQLEIVKYAIVGRQVEFLGKPLLGNFIKLKKK